MTPELMRTVAVGSFPGRLYCLVLFLLLSLPATALEFPEASQPEAWLMTYGPGEVYWQRFGHNSVWIRDAERGIDHTFNFGYFDFEQTAFFRRFLQGRMLYFGAAFDPETEMQEYREAGRTIRAQRLQLTPGQVRKLESYLVNQVQPENREYLYDYFYANCSTRLRDALDLALDGALSEATSGQPARLSIREHVNRLSWPDPLLFLGLQTALGSPIDAAASRWDEAFIPGQLADLVAEFSFADGRDLVSDTLRDGALVKIPLPNNSRVWERYLAWGAMMAAMLFIPYLRLLRKDGSAGRSSWPALVWPLFAGIGGCFLLYLWLATNHAAAAQNWNLLVLNPLLLPLSIWLLRKGTKAARITVTLIMMAGWLAAAAAWLFIPAGQDNASVLAVSLPLMGVSAWLQCGGLRTI